MQTRHFLLFFSLLFAPSLSFGGDLKIETVPVQKRVVRSQTVKTGTVLPFLIIKISSEINGILGALYVEKGEQSVKGGLLADIDRKSALLKVDEAIIKLDKMLIKKKIVDAPYRKAELDILQLKVKKAESDLQYSKMRMQRIANLMAEGQTSQDKLDEVETEYNSSKINLKIVQENLKLAQEGSRIEDILAASNVIQMAHKNLDIAKNNLNKTRLLSPVSGQISEKLVEQGEFVVAGQVLMEIVSYKKLKILFSLSEKERLSLRLKDLLTFTIPELKKSFTGKVSFISPVLDSSSHLYSAELLYLNDKRGILPGMTAKVLLLGGKKEAYPIRADWLRFNGKQLGLFLLSHGKVRFLPVTQDNYLAKEILIYSGFLENEKIITFSSQKLSPGQALR